MTTTRPEYYATPCVALWIDARIIMPRRTTTRRTDNIKLPSALRSSGRARRRLELGTDSEGDELLRSIARTKGELYKSREIMTADNRSVWLTFIIDDYSIQISSSIIVRQIKTIHGSRTKELHTRGCA